MRKHGLIIISLCVFSSVAFPSILLSKTLSNDMSLDQYKDVCSDLFSEGKMRDAEKCLKKAIELYPDNSFGFMGMGLLMTRKEKPEKALEYIDSANERAKSSDELCLIKMSFGAAYEQLDDTSKAESNFRDAVKICKTPEDNALAQNKLNGFLNRMDSKNLLIISEPPGADIEINNNYVGKTPIKVPIGGKQVPSLTFVTINALPNHRGDCLQQKIIEQEQTIPRKIFFNMHLCRQPSSIDLNVN